MLLAGAYYFTTSSRRGVTAAPSGPAPGETPTGSVPVDATGTLQIVRPSDAGPVLDNFATEQMAEIPDPRWYPIGTQTPSGCFPYEGPLLYNRTIAQPCPVGYACAT